MEADRWIYGETQDTPELHNARCNQSPQSGCHCIGDGKWCFKETALTVKTPDDKWVFFGGVELECVRDNQGSAAWNALGAGDRFFIDLNNPNEIRARVLTSSRSIGLRLRCRARYYP